MVDLPVETRAATKEDIELLAELGARTFVDAYPSYDPGDMSKHIGQTFSTSSIEAELSVPRNRFLIAWVGDEPVGYAFMQAGTDVEELAGTHAIEINRIYVKQDWINRGIGSALMKECLAEAEKGGYDTIWLGVWTENAAAIRFYERWDFKPLGTHPFRFGERTYSDLVMARDLRGPRPESSGPQSST